MGDVPAAEPFRTAELASEVRAFPFFGAIARGPARGIPPPAAPFLPRDAAFPRCVPYSSGSATPASAKASSRRRQLAQRRHGADSAW